MAKHDKRSVLVSIETNLQNQLTIMNDWTITLNHNNNFWPLQPPHQLKILAHPEHKMVCTYTLSLNSFNMTFYINKIIKYVDSYRQLTWFTQYGEILREKEASADLYFYTSNPIEID